MLDKISLKNHISLEVVSIKTDEVLYRDCLNTNSLKPHSNLINAINSETSIYVEFDKDSGVIWRQVEFYENCYLMLNGKYINPTKSLDNLDEYTELIYIALEPRNSDLEEYTLTIEDLSQIDKISLELSHEYPNVGSIEEGGVLKINFDRYRVLLNGRELKPWGIFFGGE